MIKKSCDRRLFPWSLLLQVDLLTWLSRVRNIPRKIAAPLGTEYLPILTYLLALHRLSRIALATLLNLPDFIANSMVAFTTATSGFHADASPSMNFPVRPFRPDHLPNK